MVIAVLTTDRSGRKVLGKQGTVMVTKVIIENCRDRCI